MVILFSIPAYCPKNEIDESEPGSPVRLNTIEFPWISKEDIETPLALERTKSLITLVKREFILVVFVIKPADEVSMINFCSLVNVAETIIGGSISSE